MDQLKNEVHHIHEAFQCLFNNQNPSLTDLCNHMFGEKSSLYLVCKQKNFDFEDYHVFQQFFGTFFLSCLTQLSATDLLQHPPFYIAREVEQLCLSYADYTQIWHVVASAGLPCIGASNIDVKNHRGEEPFWIMVQNALNKTLRELFIKDWNKCKRMALTIDDDKHHHVQLHGDSRIKQVCHTKDNQNGMVADTAAFSAVGVVVAVEYQCSNDTTTKSCKQLVQNLFSPIGGVPSLNNVTILMDHGYWIWGLVAWIVKVGGSVWGTVKQSMWFPFTFDQNLHDGDK